MRARAPGSSSKFSRASSLVSASCGWPSRLSQRESEIVVVIGPGETETATEADADAALAEAMTRLPPGEAAAEVSKALNLPRKPLYKRALELQGR